MYNSQNRVIKKCDIPNSVYIHYIAAARPIFVSFAVSEELGVAKDSARVAARARARARAHRACVCEKTDARERLTDQGIKWNLIDKRLLDISFRFYACGLCCVMMCASSA